jgi:hypothetical protein
MAMPELSELLSDPTLSSYREQVLEQIFCSDLLQAAWRANLPPLEIDFDDTGMLLGRLRLERVDHAHDERVEAVMEPGPTTVRANADLAETQGRMRRHDVDSLFVTTPEGLLLGELGAASAP